MKQEKCMKNWWIRITLFCILGICCQSVLCLESKSVLHVESVQELILNGEWKIIKRSLSPTLPISAYTDGGTLIILNQSPNRDIAIRITDSYGTAVIQQQISAAETAYILIPIDMLPEGIYTLELTTAWGDYLYGEFARYETLSDF